MGFSLHIGPTEAFVRESDLGRFAAFLKEREISPNERLDAEQFPPPFFNLSSDEEGVFVEHMETGWSWWSMTQQYLAHLLGTEGSRNAQSIHAWYGVALPGEFEPLLLGDPMRRQPTPKNDSSQDNAAIIAQMIDRYAGPYENLHIVSGPRLLREMEEGLERSGLRSEDPVEIYEKLDDQDTLACASCFLAMSYKFVRAGMAGGHLVWWVK